MELWTELAKTYGPAVAIISFFIWRDWKRESSMTDRLRALEDFQREQMGTMIKEMAVLQTQTIQALRDNTTTLTRMEHTMALCEQGRGA